MLHGLSHLIPATTLKGRCCNNPCFIDGENGAWANFPSRLINGRDKHLSWSFTGHGKPVIPSVKEKKQFKSQVPLQVIPYSMSFDKRRQDMGGDSWCESQLFCSVLVLFLI